MGGSLSAIAIKSTDARREDQWRAGLTHFISKPPEDEIR
jgi:hypothetical protein